MRLICPNCGAQYEVDDSVIPEGGRDVQCSNCGHTWFQRHARDAAEAEPTPEKAPEPETAPTEEPQAPAAEEEHVEETAQAGAEPDFQPEPTNSETHETAPEPTAPPEEAELAEQPPHEEPSSPAPRQQVLDDGVANILREEAEREARVRTSETPTGDLETQPDLGLGPAPSAQTHERVAQIDGPESGQEEDHDIGRRGLLPDIEEINSTLAVESAESDSAGSASPEEARQNGFRRGVTAAFVLFAVMALIYVFAAKIADAVPATAGMLSAYVDWINGLREGLDSMMLSAVDKLTGLLDQISGEQNS